MLCAFKRKSRGVAVALVCQLAIHAPGLQAEPVKPNPPPEHWLTTFQKALARAPFPSKGNMQGPVHLVFGNRLWQPGQQYANSKDWLALACNAQGCRLQPATLSVKKAAWQGHYDDTPTAGQQLTFGLSEPAHGHDKVMAWFKLGTASAALPWLKVGPVTTYYTGVGAPKSTGRGTLEALIDLPHGATASLVPVFLSATQLPKTWRPPEPNEVRSAVYLQLRANGQRQLLLGELGSCAREITGTGYLVWSGDLDGDDKPDYLVNFIDSDGPVHLYLSGAAKPGDLVGLAGVHHSPPDGGECDSPDWPM